MTLPECSTIFNWERILVFGGEVMEKQADYLFSKESIVKNHSLPHWFIREYKHFEKIVSSPTFPCTFGIAGQKRGELRYSYMTHDDWTHIPDTLKAFNQLFDQQEKLIRHGFFLFVEPEKEERSLAHYRQYFWDVLQYLHEHDDQTWPKIIPHDPEHHLWSFVFA